jgi:hypothetical protein
MLLERAFVLRPKLLFQVRRFLPAAGDHKNRYQNDGEHYDDGDNNFGIHRSLSLQSFFDAG